VYVEAPKPQVQVVVERRQQPQVVYVRDEQPRYSQEEVINPSVYAEGISYSEMWKQTVWFNEDCYKINRTGNKVTLDNVANFLNEHPETTITVRGYASQRNGVYEYNKKLSCRRCVATRNYLVSEYGININRIHMIFLGTDEPQYSVDKWNQCVVITCD
jgi:outer membrane protein OmpA-like peptidoglycan-associated protein